MAAANPKFRFVSTDRRVREDRRFVVGKGRFAADVALPNTKHVAVVTCPHPAARIVAIDKAAALALPGVHYVLDGARTWRARPRRCWPGSTRRTCRAGRSPSMWRATPANGSRRSSPTRARSPRMRPSSSRSTTSRFRSCSTARRPTGPAVRWCTRRTARTCCSTAPSCGARSRRISPRARISLSLKVKWGRSSTVPIETFGVLANWDPWRESPRRLGLDPDAALSRADRARAQAAGLGGAGLQRRRRRRQLWRQARHQACRAGGLPRAPARRPDPADRGPAGEHARRRHARPGAQLRSRPRVRRRGRDPLDEDARARQCRRLCGPLAVPARQADQRHRRAVSASRACSIRRSPSSPTRPRRRRCARSASRRPTSPSSARSKRSPGIAGSTGWKCGGAISSARSSFPISSRAAPPTTAATITPSSTRCWRRPTTPALVAERDRLRGEGMLAGIGIAACLEPSGANSTFEPLLNPANKVTTYTESCRISVDLGGAVTATVHTTSAGPGARDAGRHRGRRGAGDRSRSHPRGAAGFARRTAEPESGRQPHGDHAGRRGLSRGAEAQGAG